MSALQVATRNNPFNVRIRIKSKSNDQVLDSLRDLVARFANNADELSRLDRDVMSALKCIIDASKESDPTFSLFSERISRESIRATHDYTSIVYGDKIPSSPSLRIVTDFSVKSIERQVYQTATDVQSGPIRDSSELPTGAWAIAALPDSQPPSPSELWSRVRTEALDASSRVEALATLWDYDAENVAKYVFSELQRDDLSEDWRNTLIFMAEDVHFPVTIRDQVCDRLLVIALSLRGSSMPGIEKVVWSAMRRIASILRPTQANQFLPFLERQSVVDTRSVALLCIGRLFEPAPPASAEMVSDVADRAFAFALKFLDPDVFTAGEFALIAQNAVLALAALGDKRLEEAISFVSSLQRRWLNAQIRRRLEELLYSWKSRDASIVCHSAFANLQERLDSLR
jgi:hypothetical protein